MADPRPLFYVTGVVIAALILWVAWVLARPGPKWAEESKKPEEKRLNDGSEPTASV